MPDPIQSSSVPNQSYYDPSDQVSRVPSASSGSSTPTQGSPSPTTAPGGKDVLLKKYGAGGEDCRKHLASVGTALVVAGTSAAVGVITAPSGIGAMSGIAGTIGGLVTSAINVAGYLDCEEKNDRLRSAASDCNAQGGRLVSGAGDSDAVCIIPR